MSRISPPTSLDRSQIRQALLERFGPAHSAEPPPEPLQLGPVVPVRERVRRAVGVPLLAGAAVFVIAVVIAVSLVWIRPHRVEAAPAHADSARGNAEEQPQRSASGGSTDDDPRFVHVIGAVERPGVFRMSVGARVEDAVEAAGGLTADAVLSGVNLARTVQDGEQILIPDRADAAEPPAAAGVTAGAGTGAAPIDLNAADPAGLETLPRIGPALAQRIVEWRTANGRFRSVDDLLEVPGIGEKTLDGFRDAVRAG
ncbi:helix-hairpin-helix domain-containing protein [Leucobacter sp. HNU]|uniref:helix-hairpin-helix domain-containing protein n=1 Tax=Leucobacter sp. HNU TaxID=3236805 RepID=UPI003A7F89ED